MKEDFLNKIRNIQEQFSAPLELKNIKKIEQKKFLLCGMGGSHLAGDLLKVYYPKIDLILHSDYGLPKIYDLKQRLIFIVSYSGNTQETISSLKSALDQKLDVVVITLGGKILDYVNKYKLPAVILPDLNLQPRLAVALIFRALLKIINFKDCEKLEFLMKSFNYLPYEKEGRNLAHEIKNKIPIIYSSFQNLPLAYYFKVSFNETSKIPAFINYFPELNHNEMVGWFYKKNLNKNFYFIFLEDKKDFSLIKKRMSILKKWLKNSNFQVYSLKLPQDKFKKIFSTVILSLFASYYLARQRKVDPSEESLIEKFKKFMS